MLDMTKRKVAVINKVGVSLTFGSRVVQNYSTITEVEMFSLTNGIKTKDITRIR